MKSQVSGNITIVNTLIWGDPGQFIDIVQLV